MGTMRGPRVVVGVDGSLAGLRALRVGVTEARRRGASLHAVRAWIAPATWGGPGLPAWRQEMTAGTVEEIRQAFRDALGGLPGDLRVVLVTGEGPAAPLLSRYAYHDDDLLVVGAGRPGLPGRLIRLVRPSIARYCLAHAACPVLVIPPDSFARTASRRGTGRELRRDLAEVTSRTPSGR